MLGARRGRETGEGIREGKRRSKEKKMTILVQEKKSVIRVVGCVQRKDVAVSAKGS